MAMSALDPGMICAVLRGASMESAVLGAEERWFGVGGLGRQQ